MNGAEGESPAAPVSLPAAPTRNWRSQLVRLTLWIGAVLAVLVFLLVLTARSERAHEQLREYLVEEFSRQLGREFSLKRVEYSFLPPTVELHGARVEAAKLGADPIFQVEKLRLQTGLLDLWRRRWRLRQVEAYRPRLNLQVDAQGRLDLPKLVSGDGEQQFQVDVVVIENGEVRFDQLRIQIEAQAEEVRSRLVGDGPDSLEGQLTSKTVSLTLPGALPFEFDLAVNGKWQPGKVELVSGKLNGRDLDTDFYGSLEFGQGQDPSLDIAIQASGRGELFSHLGYLTDEVSGPLTSRGNLRWAQGEWSYRGGYSAPRLRWLDFDVSDLAGDVELRDRALRVEVSRGEFLEGQVEGWVGVDFGSDEAPVEVDLDFREVEVNGLLANQGLPLTGFGSRLEGELNYRSLRSNRRRGTGWGQFFLRPDEATGIPFVGDLPFTIDQGVLSSSAMFLTSENHRVVASGELDLAGGDGEFNLQANTEDAGELSQILLPYMGRNDQAPWVLSRGKGSVEGLLSVESFADIAVELRLDLAEVASSELAADHLRGSFRVDRDALSPLNLEMTRDRGALLATGDVQFPESPETETLVNLNFDAVDWPLGEVASWSALDIPVDGAASGRLALTGDGTSLGGEFRGFVSRARFAGHSIGTLSSELFWTSEAVEVSRLAAQAPTGVLEASGRFDRMTDGLDFRFSSQNIDLDKAPIASYFGGRLGGSVAVTGDLGGTSDNPRVDAEALFSNLSVGGRSLLPTDETAAVSSPKFEFSWSDGEVMARGSALGLLTLDGGGRLEKEGFDFRFDLASSRLRGLVELATGRSMTDLRGSLAGELQVAGALGARSSHDSSLSSPLRASLELSELEGRYQSLELMAVEPVAVDWREGALKFRSLYLAEKGTENEVFVDGTISFEDDHPVALRLQSTVDLASALPFMTKAELPEGVHLAGRADFLGTLAGPLSRVRFDGQGEVNIDPVVVPYLPQPLEALSGRFSFYPDRIELERFEAASGTGRLRARGTLNLGADLVEPNYRLYAQGTDLKVLFPDGWLQQGDLELWLSSSPSGRDLQGTVDLEQVRYLEDVEVNLAQAIERILAREREDVGTTNEWLSATQVNVKVRAPNALRVNNRAANLRGDLDLDLRGSLARPVLLGKVDLQPGGVLRYADNEYQLERGLVTFSNPNITEPVIDLVAAARVRRYEVRLALDGPPDHLSLEVTSDPPLPQLDVMALVTGGRTLDPGARPVRPGSREEGQLEAQAFLYGQAASAITDRVNTLFGFDKFRVDPLSQGSDSVSSVRLTVGKRLSKDLFVTYSRDPSSTEGDILEAEWQVGSQLVLVFTQNGDGSFSVDALWDRRF